MRGNDFKDLKTKALSLWSEISIFCCFHPASRKWLCLNPEYSKGSFLLQALYDLQNVRRQEKTTQRCTCKVLFASWNSVPLFHWFWELGDIAEHRSLEDIPILVLRTPLSNTFLPFPVIVKYESLWSSHNYWNMGFQGKWKLGCTVTSSSGLHILSLHLHTKGKCKLWLLACWGFVVIETRYFPGTKILLNIFYEI